MKAIIGISIIVGAALLAGCATAGNDKIGKLTPAQAQTQLVRGKTTEANVRAQFGDPMSTNYLANKEVQWKYTWKHAQAEATDFIPFNMHQTYHERIKTLTLLFDGKGVLQDYTLGDTKNHICSGAGC